MIYFMIVENVRLLDSEYAKSMSKIRSKRKTMNIICCREQYLFNVFEVIVSTLESKLQRIENLDKAVEHLMRRVEALDSRVNDNIDKTDAVITKLRTLDLKLFNAYPIISTEAASRIAESKSGGHAEDRKYAIHNLPELFVTTHLADLDFFFRTRNAKEKILSLCFEIFTSYRNVRNSVDAIEITQTDCYKRYSPIDTRDSSRSKRSSSGNPWRKIDFPGSESFRYRSQARQS